MGKRAELLANYFSDISKLFFAAGIVKQMVEGKYNIKELAFSIVASLILIIVAYFIQPKE